MRPSRSGSPDCCGVRRAPILGQGVYRQHPWGPAPWEEAGERLRSLLQLRKMPTSAAHLRRRFLSSRPCSFFQKGNHTKQKLCLQLPACLSDPLALAHLLGSREEWPVWGGGRLRLADTALNSNHEMQNHKSQSLMTYESSGPSMAGRKFFFGSTLELTLGQDHQRETERQKKKKRFKGHPVSSENDC